MATAAGALRTAGAVAAAHLRLAAKHTRRLDVDAVIVGYPGHLLVPFGRLLAWVRRTRLVFDPLVSLADTFAGDRALVGERSVAGRLADGADRIAFKLPDLVLADTTAHARFFAARFGLPQGRVAVVPVGGLPEQEATGKARELQEGEPLVVLQYGKWSPLHGAETVLEAAELLREAPVRFVLDRRGPELGGAARADRRSRPDERRVARHARSGRPARARRWPPTCVSACSAARRRPPVSSRTRCTTRSPAGVRSSRPPPRRRASGCRMAKTACWCRPATPRHWPPRWRRCATASGGQRWGRPALAHYRRALRPRPRRRPPAGRPRGDERERGHPARARGSRSPVVSPAARAGRARRGRRLSSWRSPCGARGRRCAPSSGSWTSAGSCPRRSCSRPSTACRRWAGGCCSAASRCTPHWAGR